MTKRITTEQLLDEDTEGYSRLDRELIAARDARRLARMARHAATDRIASLLGDECIADVLTFDANGNLLDTE